MTDTAPTTPTRRADERPPTRRPPVVRTSGEPERYSPPADAATRLGPPGATAARPADPRALVRAGRRVAGRTGRRGHAAPAARPRPIRHGHRSSSPPLLSAVLASGGTVLALDATGALDRPAPASTSRHRHDGRRQQPAGHDRRVVGGRSTSRPKVSPAVVRITVERQRRHRRSGVDPGDRRRLRRHLRRGRLDPDQPPRRRGQRRRSYGRAQGRPRVRRARSTASTP